MRQILVLAAVVWGVASCPRAAELQVQPEYLRTSPDGEIVAADRSAAGHTRPAYLCRSAVQIRFVSGDRETGRAGRILRWI